MWPASLTGPRREIVFHDRTLCALQYSLYFFSLSKGQGSTCGEIAGGGELLGSLVQVVRETLA